MTEESGKQGRGWKPQRERKVRSKKSFDEQRMAALNAEAKPYKGELEPADIKRKRKGGAPARPKGGDSAKQRQTLYSSKATPARLAALKTLREVRIRNAYAQPLIESYIDADENLSAQERAFATLLVLGVVSTSGALDAIIDRALDKPTDVKRDVRDALRVSVYEIIYLGKQPHAAVDQGVELVRSVAPSAAGLGNAVLRRVMESKGDFPYGNPTEDIEALALTYGFPVWLARVLIQDMGGQSACDFMRISNEQAPLYVCVNALTSDDAEAVEAFVDAGCELAPLKSGESAIPGCYALSDTRALQSEAVRKLLAEGKLFVSDASALSIAAGIFDMPATSILEVGAGRGTKTVALQNFSYRKTGKEAHLVSVDNHAYKTKLLRERASLCGIADIEAITADATNIDAALGNRRFDTVFVDAPCSGLGTLRRHHEIRWRLAAEHIDELAQVQLDILRSCASHVAPGGQMVYSTCTVTYAENFGVVKAFLQSEEGGSFALQPFNGASAYAPQLASQGPDAHFAVRFVRKA